MGNFAALKTKNSISSLKEKMISETATKKYGDDRYWQPQVDKAGNGIAIIRFLPETHDMEFPYVKVYDHGFNVGTKWFIEPCPTTIGEKCPCCESNTNHWNTGLKSDQEIARQRKRRLSYHSNIYVISDQKNPENEGKVFLFKYGIKIFEKLMEAVEPQFEDEISLNPFNMWEGANFRLKIRNVEGYRSYDKSDFDKVSALLSTDEERERVYNSCYNLAEIVDKSKFKPYDELLRKFNSVTKTEKKNSEENDEIDREVEKMFTQEKRSAPKVSKPAIDDDDMAMYAKLLED